jgi:hypothetical protein
MVVTSTDVANSSKIILKVGYTLEVAFKIKLVIVRKQRQSSVIGVNQE